MSLRIAIVAPAGVLRSIIASHLGRVGHELHAVADWASVPSEPSLRPQLVIVDSQVAAPWPSPDLPKVVYGDSCSHAGRNAIAKPDDLTADRARFLSALETEIARVAPADEGTREVKNPVRAIMIGSSTGGTEALRAVLEHWPSSCPPTVVCQHIPKGYTQSLAKSLNKHVRPEVIEGAEGLSLKRGQVMIAPANDRHSILKRLGAEVKLAFEDGPRLHQQRPAVDRLFESASSALGKYALGIILTGMGRDGAAGLLAMRKAGSYTIGQDEASSIVYGMPKEAHRLGAVTEQLALPQIGPAVAKILR